jgi:hypothetical protein
VSFKRMVSMERTDAEKAEERMKNEYPPAISEMPDVPPGLCIALTEAELEKLDIELDDDVSVGDVVHLSGLARVTAISKQETGNGCRCRLELAFTDLSVENEETEDAEKGKK